MNLFSTQFLKAPDFHDRLQNTKASMLNGILITLFFCTIVIGIMMYFFIPMGKDTISILAWTMLAILLVKLILQQGYLRIAATACIILCWALVTSAIMNDYGVYAPSMSAYVIVILLAGMFMDRWAGIYTAIWITVHNAFFVLLMEQGILPRPEATAHPPGQVVLVYSFSFFIAAILIFLVRRTVEDAMLRTLTTEKVLLDTLEKARQSEERFRLISSVTSDYTFSSSLSAEGGLEHSLLTGAFEAITGYTAEEFLKIGGWRATVYPDDLAQDAQDMAVLQQNKPVVSELRVIRKDGELRWVRVYATPVWDTVNNCLLGINGGVQDITARKRAEYIQTVLFDISKARTETDDLYELLKYTHEKLQTLLSAKNYYVALYNPKTELYTFPYGVDEKDNDWSDRPLKDSLTDYVRRTGKPMLITDETHDQLTQELGLELIDSWSEVWIGAPLKTSRGVIGVIAVQDYDSSHTYSQEDLDLLSYVSENISWVIDSKYHEESLKHERNLLRTIIDTIPDFLFVKDTDSRYILSNNAHNKLIGLSPSDDVIGMVSVDLQVESGAEPYLVEEHRIIETGQSVLNKEKLVENPETGDRHWLLVTKIPFYDNEGQIAGIVGVGHDITEIKRAEQERLELELQRERVEFYREFIGSMTHDLKTPVAAIKATAYLLRRIDDPIKQGVQLDRLNILVDRLQKLIDDILIVARLEHIPEYIFEEFSVNNLITEIRSQLQSKAQQKEINLALDLSSDLPDIRAARDDLLRALLNLAENAVNYTPKQGNVYLRSYREDSWVVCEIEDSGIGIEESDLPHIFEQFYRAPNARSFEDGTGLGLAIVKKIIDLHKGRIEVSSSVDKGTKFRLRLPGA